VSKGNGEIRKELDDRKNEAELAHKAKSKQLLLKVT
jgi:hypothetical protein